MPVVSLAKELPCHCVRFVALHVGLQLEFRIAWTGNQCVAGMIERPHDTMQKLIIHGMLGTVYVIPLVMSALCRGMLEYELDFIRGADVKDLRLTAINKDDGVEIFINSCPGGRSPVRGELENTDLRQSRYTRRDAMQLRDWLVLSVLLVGGGVYEAQDTAATANEAAAAPDQSAQDSAQKAAAEAKEAAQNAAQAAKLATQSAERAVNEASQTAAKATERAAHKADMAAKRAEHKTAEAAMKATAETQQAAREAAAAAKRAALATRDAAQKAEDSAKEAAESSKEDARAAAEAAQKATQKAWDATKEAADKVLNAF